MLRSMTGYGRGEVETGGLKWVVELKSVNHRFLEVSPSLPRHLWALEDRIRKHIKNRLARGRVDVQLSWEGRAETPADGVSGRGHDRPDQEPAHGPGPGPPRAGARAPGTPAPLCRPGGGQGKADPGSGGDLGGRLPALAQALEGLEVMRGNEGAALAEELVTHLDQMGGELERIKAQADLVPGLWQEKLQARLEELLAETSGVDEARLAQEVAILAERRDIREELTRLESHVAQFHEALALPGPVGRKLEFLLQEMLREANTIGVKAGDLDIAQAVVAVKGLLERLREQVQNIE